MPEREDSGQCRETETSPTPSPGTDATDRGNTVTTSRDTLICGNCDAPLTGAFCASCGQKATRSRRLDVRLLFEDLIEKALNLESSLLHTVVGLTLRPGTVCREYVNGKRTLYTNPVTYLLLVAVLSAVSNSLIRSVTGYEADEFDLFEEDWNGPITLLMTVPLAFSVALAFRRTAHTLAETYVLILYSFTHATLLTIPIQSILAPFMDDEFVATSDSNSSFYMQWGGYGLPVMFGFWLLFMIWTAKDFYGVSWASASVKMLGAVVRLLIPSIGAYPITLALGFLDEGPDAEQFNIVLLILLTIIPTAYVGTLYQWPRVMSRIIRIAAGSVGLLCLVACIYTFATEERIIGREISNSEEAQLMALVFAMMCFLSVIIFFCTGEAEGRPAGDIHGTGREGADESPPAPAAAPDNAIASQPTDQSDEGNDT